MASLFSHLAIGATVTKVSSLFGNNRRAGFRLYALAMFSSAMPDLDVVAFNFGIPYSHWLGHRGLSHSFLFAGVWTLLMILIFYRNRQHQERMVAGVVILISTISHGIIDACTNGGRGIGFLIPFSDERFFLPFRPIQVSPLGAENFFSEWGIRVLQSELYYIFLPCVIIWLVSLVIERVTLNLA